MSNVQVNVIPDLLPSFQPVKAIDFQFGDNYVLEVTANSQYAIASASDRLIRLYDLNNLELATTLKGHEGAITKIKLYGDQYLLSSSDDGQWVRWDLRTGAPAQTFKYTRYVSAFDLNCNDTMGILGTDSYGATQAAELVFFDTRKTDILSIFEESHGDDITDIECHPSIPSQMISASTDGLINNYDVMDFDEQEALISVMNSGSSVTKAGYFGPEAEYVYCLTHIETFSLFTLEGDVICDYGAVRDINVASVEYAITCSYDPFSRRFYLITGNNSGQVQLFHVNIGELQLCQVLEAPGGHSDIVRAFYWNHQTQSILTGGEDGRMCAWQGTS
ncbi:hypothetical protein VTP01DRAFT_10959 [Rhizomucor pusillus]|uniref:uncharacterized protein n=1 Tax=Rhizomucor pusillus TaxID=4840 RepID=UPI0037421B5D